MGQPGTDRIEFDTLCEKGAGEHARDVGHIHSAEFLAVVSDRQQNVRFGSLADMWGFMKKSPLHP